MQVQYLEEYFGAKDESLHTIFDRKGSILISHYDFASRTIEENKFSNVENNEN